ncbi:uncharacterized protein LOC114742750 [Neltuma alba]|uniref:uncharacterized protein LOC114742750 n=1 Tax=Neltuma alba TaxID=207710 RepID=UPI0010A2B11E|nr:uncharacterized protein LOC114742750 [Prosopis alba]
MLQKAECDINHPFADLVQEDCTEATGETTVTLAKKKTVTNGFFLELGPLPQVVLFSTGVMSLAVTLKFSVPLVSDFIVSDVPNIWSFFLTWLRPPYLYILVNCIIISIAASSKFMNHKLHDQARSTDPPVVLPTDQVKMAGEIRPEYAIYNVGNEAVSEADMISSDLRTDYAAFSCVISEGYVHDWKVQEMAPEVQWESGVGSGEAKRQDTLESTWRTMTEGRAMPLTRHLKKSDTWDSNHHRNDTPLRDRNGCTPPNSKLMKKSETFSEQSRAYKENNSSASSSPGSAKMRKEPSLSQDELNRRVEAFIRKFNEEMRLQRQESLRQYREMINSGAR